MTLRSALGKSVAALAAGVMLVSLGACGSSNTATQHNDIISVNDSEPQHGLVPSNTIESGGGNVLRMLFDGLISVDYQGNSHMEVAQSITPNSDASQFTIKLKDGWTFTNGEPITAESFARAWSYCANVRNGQLGASFMSLIKGYDELQDPHVDANARLSGVQTPDEHTLVVTLNQPDAVFPAELGHVAFYPLPSVAYDDMTKFSQHPIGNGPYTFDEWNHNENILLKRNEQYIGSRKAQNAGIDYRIYTSMDSAYADVMSGNLDLLDNVPQSEIRSFKEDPTLTSYSQPGSAFQSFIIPERLAHFGLDKEGDLRRQAISMAINRPLICDKLFNGTRMPATDFTSPLVPEYAKELPGAWDLKYNPSKAKALWAEANKISPWPETATFKIAYNSDGDHREWVEAVSNEISNTLGIAAQGEPYATFSDLRDRISDRTINTGFRAGWTLDYPSAENYFSPLYTTASADGKGSNDGDYKSAEFDAALAAALRQPEEQLRRKDFDHAQEILLRDLPAIPLWVSNISAVSGKDIHNVHFDYSNTPTYQTITKS
ncbi:peptide ABC transporter substrate-binding protein [Bifidobacterium gallicum]|uniref:ABC transporter substrate-binding protein n=1 Tax=Bifidobacterium gallicum DSM 20093 = LMG 11596 TaxID=561180 RepID=D1NTE2_9BIFI|nr:ABC transporter substrate-binding protein [Bifidobacterium gallicum]EFA22996.1 ABC transporter, substrate-binding protein, family 5 [Bifidobacterium gallicum DSM 20093 = LMG 11596]KFI57687.1 ABC transporter substrate-binding protein [Bifidobacterium gallicum DSM 20093 = LMG 11596]